MSDLPKTRESLLIRLGQKSDEAWTEFIEVYEQAIYAYGRRRGLQDADAWDVTQDVLAAVEKKIGDWNFDPTAGKFRGWLFRVARNIAVDKVLAQAKRAASGDSLVHQMLQEQPESLDQESSLFWTNYRKKLFQWAANQVRPNVKSSSWKAFWKTSIEGRKPDEVAAELSLSVGSVYAAKFRIVNRIRDIVSRLDDESFDLDNELLKGNPES